MRSSRSRFLSELFQAVEQASIYVRSCFCCMSILSHKNSHTEPTLLFKLNDSLSFINLCRTQKHPSQDSHLVVANCGLPKPGSTCWHLHGNPSEQLLHAVASASECSAASCRDWAARLRCMAKASKSWRSDSTLVRRSCAKLHHLRVSDFQPLQKRNFQLVGQHNKKSIVRIVREIAHTLYT